jgi:hypothetical protein
MSEKPLVVDLGDRVTQANSDAENYALFMMEPTYKPCL